jgi:DNA processing protein
VSAPSPAAEVDCACAACVRRSWLLCRLGGQLEYCARDRGRLQALLAVEDGELIDALGGRRRGELRGEYDSFEVRAPRRCAGAQALCRHDPRYPLALLDAPGAPGAPRMLNVLGGAERLAELCSAPAVAILGSRRPSDYGREMARSLARGLTVSGVSVIAGWQDGIAVAAHEGALEAGGAGVAVLSDGLEVAAPVRRRALLGRLAGVGCAVSELPCDCGGRRWGQLASERTVVALATVAIVVEAERTAGDLAAAGLAEALGRTVAALPGRVTSPLSQGANALLARGARVVRDAADVLELLYEIDSSRTPTVKPTPEPLAGALKPTGGTVLDARLQSLLERVGAGSDTPDSLAREGVSLSETLAGLTELELMGLLSRGDGGRYLPTRS